MKIKMTTTSCGPDTKFNFNEGQTRNVSVEEARYWFEKGCCKLLEPFPSAEKAVVAPAEKAVITAPERAVVKPTETAKVVVSPEVVKVPVATPAKSTTVASAKAATWGTPEVK